LLTASGEFQNLDPSVRRDLAHGLVQICSTALALNVAAESPSVSSDPAFRRQLAVAQSAGSEYSGVAASRVAETTNQILTAVSFPRFVTELINGVFKAMVDSNQQQLSSFVELIRNVAASTGGFADANVSLEGARRWLAERFPEAFTVDGEADPFAEPGQPLSAEEQAERDSETRLRLKPGASMPSEGALRSSLGLGPDESVSSGDPENLVGLARSALARSRQQVLSTMVMLGLQRIVIESGRLHASMRFHIDTRSAAQDDRGSQFDARHTNNVGGSVGFGPWGASASMTNTIGFVSTQKTQTTEEMNTDLDLNSSVELVFKSDYLPLDRLAGRAQVDRIKVNTLNPESEIKASTEARQAREKRITESEGKRRESLDKAISAAPAPPAAPKPMEPGSVEAAEKARKDAEERDKKDKKKEEKAEPKPKAAAGAGSTGAPANSSSSAPANSPANSPANPPVTPPAGQGEVRPPAPPPGNTRRGNPAQAHSLALEEASTPPRLPDVIFVPTFQEAVDEMLDLAALRPGEVLYDL